MAPVKGTPFVVTVIQTCVQRSLASPMSSRQVEARMQERGVSGDHAPLNRRVV
jgi:transposase-like protein